MLAIPQKRFAKATVSFLTPAELQALLAAPDLTTWEGRRDRALILLAAQTGLRVSEIIGLNRGDVGLGAGAHVRCEGKGRKQRAVPLDRPRPGGAARMDARTRRTSRGPAVPDPHRPAAQQMTRSNGA